jgi:hypothetical protein
MGLFFLPVSCFAEEVEKECEALVEFHRVLHRLKKSSVRLRIKVVLYSVAALYSSKVLFH